MSHLYYRISQLEINFIFIVLVIPYIYSQKPEKLLGNFK